MDERDRSGADPSPRDLAIATMATAEGARWAASWFDALRADGRRASGGWPGTMTEARARVSVGGRSLSLNAAEIVAAGRCAYEAARKAWSARALADHEGVEDRRGARKGP